MTRSAPNYVQTLADLMARIGDTRGGVYAATTSHDDNCRHWRGGACDCAPDVALIRIDDTSPPNERRHNP